MYTLLFDSYTDYNANRKSYFPTIAFLYSSGLTPGIPQIVYQYFWTYPFLLFNFSFFQFLVFGSVQ